MTIPLAVYGSLRLGLALPHQPPDFDALLQSRQPCLLSGWLLDLGTHPGLVDAEDPEATVIGELCQLPDEEALERFDAYEGFDLDDVAGSRYLRRWVRLLSPEVEAWTYVYNRAWTSPQVVPSGDWATHLAVRRR